MILVQDLNGYGQSDTLDLTIQLFDLYMTVPDKIFCEMFGQKKTNYLLRDSTMNPTNLMAFTQTAFNVRMSNISVSWMQNSEEQVQIEALLAELKLMKNQKVLKKNKKKDTKPKGDNSSSKDTAKDINENKGNDKWAWKKIVPDNSEPEKQMVDGKWYHWCPHQNKAWTVHKPLECKLKDKKPAVKVEGNTAEVETTNFSEDPDDNRDNAGLVLASYAAALGGAASN